MANLQELNALIQGYRTEAERFRQAAQSYEQSRVKALQQVAVCEARINGMLEAAELLGATDGGAQPEPRRRTRRLSEHWQKMMHFVNMLPDFDYDALESAAEAAGHKVGRDTLRSQMSLYKTAGLVEADENGRFRLTAVGRRAAGIVSPLPRRDQLRPIENEPPSGWSAGGSDVDDAGVGAPASS